jgi:regulatory protein
MAAKFPNQDGATAGAEPDAAGERGPRARRPNGRKIPRKVSAQSLENAALYYLARFSASSAHLKRVLLRRVDRSIRVHGGDATEGRRLVDALVERFCRSGLLDDAAYAAGKARSLRRRGTSRSVIARTLRAKGVTADQTDAALAELTAESDAGDDEDERAAAARLAQRKRLGPFRPKAARTELRQRDMAALARAGFSYDVARQVIDADSADSLDDLIRRRL